MAIFDLKWRILASEKKQLYRPINACEVNVMNKTEQPISIKWEETRKICDSGRLTRKWTSSAMIPSCLSLQISDVLIQLSSARITFKKTNNFSLTVWFKDFFFKFKIFAAFKLFNEVAHALYVNINNIASWSLRIIHFIKMSFLLIPGPSYPNDINSLVRFGYSVYWV